MRTIEMDQATESLAKYARKASKATLVVTDYGKPIAALVPLPNTDWETATLSSNPKFMDIIKRSRTRIKTEGGITSAELRRRLKQKAS